MENRETNLEMYNKEEQQEKKEKINNVEKNDRNTTIWIVVAVLTFPIWISIIAGVGGTILGIAVSIFGGVIGLGIAGFSVLVTAFSTGGFAGGLMLTGIAFLLLSITVLLILLFVLFCGKFIPWLIQGIKKAANNIFGNKEEVA